MKIEEDVILIAGPTASGKTGLAIDLAKSHGAIILNTDSMQVYSDLRILSARPTDEEEKQAPHLLFGHVSGDQPYSVAHWKEDVASVLKQEADRKRPLVFVGGTGLYFNALLHGLSPIPDIKPEIREKWRARSLNPGSGDELFDRLLELDRSMADRLRPSDTQRIVRALEVIESTGVSLSVWQTQKGVPLFSANHKIKKLLLMPDRSVVHERINHRFEQMVEQGGISEVKTLMEKGLNAEVPVMKAIGVPQLISYLKAELSLEAAIEKSKAATRQYAKRQSTWFRNSFGADWEILNG
ncbi:MAG: tRNA (adenosine(37)-N6)-dimethylallyltransferase MiaA [Pseudomonadota bacterium]